MRFLHNKWTIAGVTVVGLVAAGFLVWAGLSLERSIPVFENTAPMYTTIHVPEDVTRMEVARQFGQALGWNNREQGEFAAVYAQIQWDAFKVPALAAFTGRFDWTDEERELFITNSSQYLEPGHDFLGSVYMPGNYTIKRGLSMPQIANKLVARTQKSYGDQLETFILQTANRDAMARVAQFIEAQQDLLPDLVPLPPQDITLQGSGDTAALLFSTTYYNQGRGPLELLADPETAGAEGDVERNVFQRIYRTDGGARNKLVGEFLWHNEHLHYHYSDFVLYQLEAVDIPGISEEITNEEPHGDKATFCIRDASKVSLNLEHTPGDAQYKVCGKERQGISVGWGDTYFYTYQDQSMDISDLPSGTYRLSFLVNPEERLEETDIGNNGSNALLKIDKEVGEVEVLEEIPQNTPEVEHVYKEQVFD